eukprot:maker-scaffold_7-snap-gene-1.3-mRNA-1 protein AED:0.32 eAED:0.32 QI:306/0.5/0.33/1/1/1/3/0/122
MKETPPQDTKTELIDKVDIGEEPKVYFRRWIVLVAYSITMFTWALESYRHVSLVSEFSLYYDTTNEFNPGDGEWGIDSIGLVSTSVAMITYPVAGYMVDRFGLMSVIFGAFLQAFGGWVVTI